MKLQIKFTYVHFRLLEGYSFELKTGTKVYGCFNNTDSLLGKIKWPVLQRQYCFIPRIVILNSLYLCDIITFLDQLNYN